MKPKCIYLLLFLPIILLSNNQENFEEDYDINDCCCEEQSDVCCTYYAPQFYDLQCACGIFITADFLYWYSKETGLYYALKFTGVNTVPDVNQIVVLDQRLTSAPVEYMDFDTKWRPGGRVGLGYNFSCDGWDIYVNWTYFKNKATEKNRENLFTLVPEPGNFGFLNPWVNPAISNTTTAIVIPTFQGPMFYKIKAHWEFTLNAIDLELGRKYWLSRCFNLRPYVGLRGAWTNILFKTLSLNFIDFPTGILNFGPVNFHGTFKDHFKDQFWGVGLLGGIEPVWYFSSCFALFGDLDFSLLWGKFKNTNVEKYSGIADIRNDGIVVPNINTLLYNAHAKNDFFSMQSILDLALGLRFERTWCCDLYRTNLDLGWEHHIWFNHTHRSKLVGRSTTIKLGVMDYFNGVCEESHDISFGGFVLRARFDF